MFCLCANVRSCVIFNIPYRETIQKYKINFRTQRKEKKFLFSCVVQSDENGNIIYIPAREVFTKLYNEPVPEF